MNIDQINKNRYQRAFFFKKLGYLMTCFVHFHYRKRNFLWIYRDEMMGSYIENSAAEKASKIGFDIFSNESNFALFEKGFRQIIVDSEIYIKKTKALNSITVGDLYDLRGMICRMYYYFEKTEFFFTDGCYKKEMGPVLKKNLFILGDDLKMKSRPLIVELLTTMVYHLADIVAKSHNLDLEDVKFYSFDELVALLESGIRVSQDVIIYRQKSFVLYSEDENVIEIQGKEKENILERFKEDDHTQKTEFKGTIANKGHVIAKVRVILAELDQDYNLFIKKLHSMEMEPGDILVTETTSPDFVPLMKKAGGIIANQGGLNSHAAIISRELGVPCLVGTYHATDILKTGDLVELDANNGIVRIVEKSK